MNYIIQKNSDILLSFKREIIQVYLITVSNIFKSLIKLKKNNNNINETIKIILLESYNLITFKEILKYIHENLGILKY